MRGSIVRRKDRFYVVTDVPPGPDGKRRQKWHAGYPTRREAEQQLRRALCELDAGRWVEPSDRTVAAYLLEDWLPAMATTVRPATLRIYRQSITAYVLPALGHRRLADLDPLLLTKHYAALLATPMQRRVAPCHRGPSGTSTSSSSTPSPTRCCGDCWRTIRPKALDLRQRAPAARRR